MMNKYIAIEMSPTQVGIGGSFMATASFKLDNACPEENICLEYLNALEENFGIR